MVIFIDYFKIKLRINNKKIKVLKGIVYSSFYIFK